MFKTNDLSKAMGRLDAAYNKEWRDWLPETLETIIIGRWGGINGIDLDRLLTVRNLFKFGWFWHDVDIFEASVHALNWQETDHRENLHPSPGQIAYAVSIVRQLIDDTDIRLDEDVAQYIASVFLNKNYVYIPEEFNLHGVQPYMDIFHKNIEFRDAVKTKWQSMMGSEDYNLEETPVDVQLARLLAIKKFVDMGGTGVYADKNRALAKLILN